MSIILHVDEDETLDQLERRKVRAYLSAYSADITDDGKTIMLHWDYGDTTYIEMQELLVAYMEKHGIVKK